MQTSVRRKYELLRSIWQYSACRIAGGIKAEEVSQETCVNCWGRDLSNLCLRSQTGSSDCFSPIDGLKGFNWHAKPLHFFLPPQHVGDQGDRGLQRILFFYLLVLSSGLPNNFQISWPLKLFGWLCFHCNYIFCHFSLHFWDANV